MCKVYGLGAGNLIKLKGTEHGTSAVVTILLCLNFYDQNVSHVTSPLDIWENLGILAH